MDRVPRNWGYDHSHHLQCGCSTPIVNLKPEIFGCSVDREEFDFDQWHFSAVSTKSILPSLDPCEAGQKFPSNICDFCTYKESLNDLPSWPEMIFPKNRFVIERSTSSKARIEFNALDALKFVDTKQDWVKVHSTKDWANARAGCQYIGNTIKPFDWTFSTSYRGSDSNFDTIESTDERINVEKLMQREKILFYQEIPFFEDELADNGCSSLQLKFRCMPSSFFCLLRFFLRVDKVLVKTNDTRIYWETGRDYLLREYTSRQKFYEEMSTNEREKCMDANEIWKYLPTSEEIVDVLHFV